ncbi:MAG: alpha/beta fold hydrolase, partial [Planctomycetota bacterium]
MLGFIQLLLIGLACLWLAMTAYVAWGLTHPPRRTYASAVSRGLPGDPGELDRPRSWDTWLVRLAHARHEAEVWSVEGDDSAGPVVLLVHGWGDSRIGGLVRTPHLARHASRVVLFDQTGHGTTGAACRLGTREVDDVRVVLDRIREAFPDRDIALYGWSLGAGVNASRYGASAMTAETR